MKPLTATSETKTAPAKKTATGSGHPSAPPVGIQDVLFEVKPKRTGSSELDQGGVVASGGRLLAKLWSVGSTGSGTATKPSLVAPTRVDASLLRGITTQTLLERCGAAFRSQEFHVQQHYQKSFATEHLGDFVSHDWASSRLSKLWALGLVYNSQVALIASAVTSLVLAVLQYGPDPILPPPRTGSALVPQAAAMSHPGSWCMVISPWVFIGFFLFWQDLRAFFARETKTCFLDKYCIDQANPERKAAGILGLAGFLRCSDRIIILWTPRYFTRLWCTYEIASWLHLKKPLSSVLFMPLAHANIIMTLWMSGCFSYTLFLPLSFVPLKYSAMVIVLVFSIGVFWETHQMRHCVAQLRAIKEQLENFSVTSASCFCCTTGHEGPNNEEVACDREVVYSTIAQWFNDVHDDASVTQEVRLDRFDQAVRRRFAAQVLEKAGPTQLAYRYVVIGGWPFLFRLCDVISASAELDGAHVYKAVIKCLTYVVALMPLWYKLTMRVTCLVDARFGVPRSKFKDWCASAVVMQLHGLTSILVFSPLESLVEQIRTPLWPFLTPFWAGCHVLLTMYVYSSDLPGWCHTPRYCKRRSPAKPVVSTASSAHPRTDSKEAEEAEKMERADTTESAEKVERADTPDRAEMAEKAEKAEQTEAARVERAETEKEKEKEQKEEAYELDNDIFSIHSI